MEALLGQALNQQHATVRRKYELMSAEALHSVQPRSSLLSTLNDPGKHTEREVIRTRGSGLTTAGSARVGSGGILQVSDREVDEKMGIKPFADFYEGRNNDRTQFVIIDHLQNLAEGNGWGADGRADIVGGLGGHIRCESRVSSCLLGDFCNARDVICLPVHRNLTDKHPEHMHSSN